MKKVLQFTDNEKAAKEEIEQKGGRVLHQFSPFAFVAHLPKNVKIKNLSKSTHLRPSDLDEVTQLAVDAWLEEENETGTTSGEENSTPRTGHSHLRNNNDFVGLTRTFASTGTETSRYMIGSIAVGIIIVSRDQGPEKFSAAEETRVLRGVERALDWLVALEPRARVSFTYDIRRITITSPPGPYAGITEYPEKYEKGWRDETLGNMGYSDGRAGYQKYVTDLKTAKQTDWAYVAFFTKYELFHYAYSVWEKIVIDYRNDWLGPSQLHRTFAHETCHIFGAVDEDDETNCNCDGVSGHLEVPNKNCANCFSPDEQQAECVMNYYTMVMCEWSRKQIGWDVSLYPN